MSDNPTTDTRPPTGRIRIRLLSIAGVLLIFIFGIGIGYFLRDQGSSDVLTQLVELAADSTSQRESQVTMPDHYTLPVEFGDIGPELLETGAIDYERFIEVYDRAGQPLTEAQRHILRDGSSEPIVINRENAYFLLNLFWAFGLTNQNPILTEGPLAQYDNGNIGNFASTGGWTIGTRPVTELYSSTPILTLTAEQQARLEEVAEAVYRPCCNNHTAFADCNHGMAMLGLLEVMAAHDATVDTMFEAAKYINVFWFPQQTAELVLFFQTVYGQEFANIDARQTVGPTYFSASGFRSVHQFLADNNLLQQNAVRGGSCGV